MGDDYGVGAASDSITAGRPRVNTGLISMSRVYRFGRERGYGNVPATNVRQPLRSCDEHPKLPNMSRELRPVTAGARIYLCDADPGVLGGVAIECVKRYRR